MTIRFYVVPLIGAGVHGDARRPKYIAAISGLAWGAMDYGLYDVALVAADVSAGQHTSISANSDVVSAPANIDNTITAGALTNVKSALEALNIPANWATTANTYRDVLRVVAGIFQFAQRYHGMHNKQLLPSGVTLDTQFQDLPAAMQTELVDVADSMQIDRSGATGTITVRQILKAFADAWQGKTFYIGGFTL